MIPSPNAIRHSYLFMVMLPVVLFPPTPASAHEGHYDLGAPLSLTGAVQTLDEDFKSQPQWREGGVQVTTASPRTLNDPTFSWAAGHIWDHPPVGAPKIWPPPEENLPAWTSNGQADADPNGDMIAQIGESYSPFAWQPWRNEHHPDAKQRREIERLESQTSRLRELKAKVLRLAAEIRKGTIDRVFEKDDLQLGVEALARYAEYHLD